jgi:subtilase family serine protease
MGRETSWRMAAWLVGTLATMLTASASAASGAMPLSGAGASPIAAGLSGVTAGALALPGRSDVRAVTMPGRSNVTRFHCQEPGAEFECYGPRQIRAAYGFNALLREGKDGSGQTIVIIDAFQDPTLSSDLSSFDSAFNLAAPPSFEVVAPFGLTPFEPANPNQVGWSGEIALDVEWAHAIAPGAKLILALAPSNSNGDMVSTERYVIEHNLGDVVSMSFGETEGCTAPTLQEEEHNLFKTAVNQGMTLVSGTGDWGAAQFTCEETGFLSSPAVATPSSDPNVTAVGGTRLVARLTSGRYESESVWNESETEEGAGGGGFSSLYAAPKYQRGVSGISSQRGVPDITYDAAAHGGLVVAWGSRGTPGEFWIFSGTSEGTPQWAALTAIADQVAGRRLGNINPALYQIGQRSLARYALHDITVGNNSYAGVTGYAAGPGWDAASGWGSPKASRLVKDLVLSGAESGDQSSAIRGASVKPRPNIAGAGKGRGFKPL